MPPTAPRKPTRWQRWRILCYGLLSIVLVIALFWAFLKYEEHREWARIDELLAEQDKKHPGWRWHEFLPKPLQPGQPNGALRFMEVGKQLTVEMLTLPEYPDEDSLDVKMFTREWLTTINRDSVRASNKHVREKCKHLESNLPSLVELQPGCPPFNTQRPSAESLFLPNGPLIPLLRDEVPWNLVGRWLFRVLFFHIDEDNGDLALQAWRALLAFHQSESPGVFSRGIQNYRDFNLCYQILAKTQPTEPAMLHLQQTVVQWRKQLVILDDLHMDRAFAVQLLLEMKDQSKDAFLTGLHQLYAKPPAWIPKGWRESASKLGIGSPSLPFIYRMEILSNMQMFDSFENQLKQGKPWLTFDQLDNDGQVPGKHFAIYFLPRWKKILADQRGLYENLLCLEALIAAERYRLKHGDYPRQWSDLVPSLLQAVPRVHDLSYMLKSVPEGLVIYLPRATNLGGKVLRFYNPLTDEFEHETDNGLIIFYPKHRRQPPPPVKPKLEQDTDNP